MYIVPDESKDVALFTVIVVAESFKDPFKFVELISSSWSLTAFKYSLYSSCVSLYPEFPKSLSLTNLNVL